ncbi:MULTISPECIES: recombinase family protein [Bacillus cereus group]|uniref:recombinase family protein n=2 Tax=Bacteria TaxID=2 RepID=UPI002157B54D
MKKHVFFRRVSTEKQDLTLQEKADLSYREKLLDDEIMIMDEVATSANKLSISQRPLMQELITLIEGDQVECLYAFDRSRLFRNFYEGVSFNDLCKKHNIKIVFTSSSNGHIEATNIFCLEAFLYMQGDAEGKSIARRSREIQKRYPPQKLGYIKDKVAKKYQKNEEKAPLLTSFFTDIAKLTSVDELALLLKKYSKELKCSDERLIKIASDPFYAGYDLSKDTINLPYVDAYLSLEEFNRIQLNQGPLFQAYTDSISALLDDEFFKPICGHCLKPMNYHVEKVERTSFFSCTNKHRKIVVFMHDLKNITQKVLETILEKLNTSALTMDSIRFLNTLKRQILSDMQQIDRQREKLVDSFLFETEEYCATWKEHPKYQKYQLLLNEKQFLLNKLDETKKSMGENTQIVELVTYYLKEQCYSSFKTLCTLLIRNIIVYPDFIDIETSKMDYVQNMETEFIYEGGEAG